MSNPSVVPMRAPKVAETIADQFRQSIADRELRPGDLLPRETTLLAQFGVSRPTLREALRVLEAEGLIAVTRGAHGGARVLAPSAVALGRSAAVVVRQRGAGASEVVAALVEIEVSAVRALARPEGRTALATLSSPPQTGPDVGGNADHGGDGGVDDFHGRLVASVNPVNALLREALLATGLPAGAFTHGTCADAQSLRMHLRMLRLVARGEADEAERTWRAHLDRWTPRTKGPGTASLPETDVSDMSGELVPG